MLQTISNSNESYFKDINIQNPNNKQYQGLLDVNHSEYPLHFKLTFKCQTIILVMYKKKIYEHSA